MDFGNLSENTFAQNLLLAVVSAILPLLVTYLTEHFGWRAALRKDAELFTYLRDTAGDDMDESESELLHALRARVFSRARSHTIERSKGLRLLSKGFNVLVYAPFLIIVIGIILRTLGHPEFLQRFSDYAQWIVLAIFLLGAIMAIWSILDWYRWSRTRQLLADKNDP